MWRVVQHYGLCVSNPLLGGAEAEGFGVGIDDEEPTPALRATPPERDFSDSLVCKLSARNLRGETYCFAQEDVT